MIQPAASSMEPVAPRAFTPAPGDLPAALAPMLDTAYMASLLRRHAYAGEPITECRIEHVHYKTYRSPASAHKAHLTVSYRIRFARNSAGTIALVKGYLGGRSREALQGLDADQARRVLHLADPDLLVWRFPDDPRMPWLGRLIDPAAVHQILPWQQLDFVVAEPGSELRVEARIAHYRPEQRCLMRYRLSDPAGVTNWPEIYAKTFAGDQAEKIHHRIVHHWHAGCHDPNRFLVARPLGWYPPLNLVWQQALPVTPMDQALATTPEEPWLERLALALAGFHRESGGEWTALSNADLEQESTKKLAKLRQAYPEYRLPLSNLARLVETPPAGAEQAPRRLIHNDLHLRQLGVCGERIALFDFDEFHCGDPTQDLADLVVDLMQDESKRAAQVPAVRRLLRAYGHHADWRIDRANLDWHLRHKLIAKAYRAHIQRLADTRNRVAELLALAHAVDRYDLLPPAVSTSPTRQ